MTAADRAELEGVSAERAPQIVAGALVAEASMRALSIDTVDICPWALREGLILRKLDSEADGTALVETSVADADQATREAQRQHTMTGPEESYSSTQADIGRGVAGEERNDRRTAGRRSSQTSTRQHRIRHGRRADRRDPDRLRRRRTSGRRGSGHRRARGGPRGLHRPVVPQRRAPSTSSEVDERGRAVTDEEADYAAHIEERDAEPLFAEPERRRPHYAHSQRRYHAAAGVGAEQMSPDPVDIDDDDAVAAVAADLGLTRPALAATTKPDTDDEADELPSYLRSSGQTAVRRRDGRRRPGPPRSPALRRPRPRRPRGRARRR